ncbi:helix-turn-helix domain-containing protein [Paenibacillus chitinolyticus]|uniref:helix-turn-helix domain-containing protein n=1 Tax=Paenibacillus chitinolyticus TaxID=79263 RepID=UPI002DBC420E|nr:helix-turn-helix domain-containing protein [Paenibacillus chitinolyticus]MEC0244317.1 helix-turn-helix domain-containing protein [Paenibacillus chitinolyticus]
MANKAEILMHPVRMKISQVLMRNKDTGLTSLEMVKIIKDVPQATLYRHIQVMLDAGIIRVFKEKKVKSVAEKYYVLNELEAKLNVEEWKKASREKKLDYVSYYQLSLMTQYQIYLKKIEEQNTREDSATFSLVEMKLDEEQFRQFQHDLNELMMKYYHSVGKDTEAPVRTIAITIIPDA